MKDEEAWLGFVLANLSSGDSKFWRPWKLVYKGH